MSIKRLGRQKGNDYPAGLNLSNYGSYQVTKSLRFRAANSAYLSRTPASAGNRRTWTLSWWMKIGSMSQSSSIFYAYGGDNAATLANIGYDSNTLYMDIWSFGRVFQTTEVYRDPSAWYHFVLAFDDTQATGTNRVKLYVNNVLQTFSTYNAPTQNTDFAVNGAFAHNWGRDTRANASFFDGYITEAYLIDGQALTPSSFGATDPITTQWQPVAYSGTYGTNGFYLPFSNATSVFTLGNDPGNGNNWTLNNFSLTAGVTYDSMNDAPTLTNPTAANYATFNTLIPAPTTTVSATYSNGNLTATCPSAGFDSVCWATIAIPSSGLWYWEVTASSQNTPGMIGIAENNGKRPIGGGEANARGIYSGGGQTSSVAYIDNTTGASYSPGWQNKTVGVALDMTNGAMYFSVDGTYLNSGDPTSGASKTGALFTDVLSALPTAGWIPTNFAYNGTVLNVNFGQRPFAYTPPTGFVALNTYNLPDPTIKVGNKQFDVNLWTGNGTAQRIANAGNFQPDLVWVKQRNGTYRHQLVDSIRGATKALFSSDTDAEGTYQGVTAFNFNGFSVGTELGTNESGSSFVGWQWKGGATAVTNTNGTITSQVSANPTAGFSIVTWSASNISYPQTVGHGLGVTPSLIIVKPRSYAGGWYVYHSSLGPTQLLQLQSTAATQTTSTPWNNTAPTSSVFTAGSAYFADASNNTYVTYCFAPITGYSAFGSYTGNGSADGPFIYTGFKPKWLMIKRTDSATSANWTIMDTTRDTYNPAFNRLNANITDAEYTGTNVLDILSNGFKLRWDGTNVNASGGTLIYAAFAEYPFKNGNAAIYNIN
jgi:hypothetical protein